MTVAIILAALGWFFALWFFIEWKLATNLANKALDGWRHKRAMADVNVWVDE